MTYLKRMVVLVSLTSFCGGCASIANGERQNISINPSQGENIEALVETDGMTTEVSLPGFVRVARSADPIKIKIEDPGYERAEIELQPRTSMPYWLNVGIIAPFSVASPAAGVVAMFLTAGVDLTTGKAYEYDEKAVIPVTPKTPD
jgi:hypothetical protein